mmetsp:Transcript_122091/g.352913  ORF Transcript_122091/g.352913 Transcript_122091/m.352913 type:complete len:468 (-) Transcript_122091:89-1492(-)
MPERWHVAVGRQCIALLVLLLLLEPRLSRAARLQPEGDGELEVPCDDLGDSFWRCPNRTATFAVSGTSSPLRTEALRELHRQLAKDLVLKVLDLLRFRYQVALCSECTSVSLLGTCGPRRMLEGYGSTVAGLRFFPLGDRALTWSQQDEVAVIWDTASGEVLRELRHDAAVKSGRVFPGGDRVVTRIEDGRTVIWDASTGQALHIIGRTRVRPRSHFLDMVQDMEVFPSANRLLTWGRKNSAAIWDATSGRLRCHLCGHVSAISVAQVFPDSARVITGGFDSRAIIWDASRCRPLRNLSHSVWVTGVAVIDAGETVATVSVYGVTTIWSASLGVRLRTLIEPPPLRIERTLGLETFPGGSRLVTYNSAEAIIWNTTSGEALHRFVSKPNATQGLTVSPGGDMLVTCGGGRVTVWDTLSGAVRHTFEERFNGRPLSQDGTLSCFVAIALGAALSEQGFGNGFSWRELP